MEGGAGRRKGRLRGAGEGEADWVDVSPHSEKREKLRASLGSEIITVQTALEQKERQLLLGG